MSSLYERLGRTEGIRKLVETVIALHLKNPVVAKRYEPVAEDPERLKTVLDHFVDFLEEGAGGPASYGGKSMVDAHRGMNISGDEYIAVLDDIMQGLRTLGIDEATQKDVLFISYSLKPEIAHI